jgi:arginyl-tRNA synthetase
VFTESEGAIVYIPDESKKNLNTSVFINSQGNPTYDAKDIGLLDLKYERYSPDFSLFVTDHEQIPHFNIVLDAAEHINPLWKQNSIHIAHGRMSFKGAKMSSRLGNTPLVTDMLNLVLEEVNERSAEREIDYETKEAIAIGAIKFAILRAKPGQNINFDPETSLSFEGDSGPYLQYTHARIVTLLEKAGDIGLAAKLSVTESEPMKLLYRFPEVVESAITEYAPNYIVTYLLEIARAFNSFYGANKIIDPENREISEHRLAIARATQIVLANGLDLLGIMAPEKM